ncbi:MAG: lamin tail domain-containing protein, partial [Clostridia bacterium]|nr:lamin tail domain-containing protein [Clostridia bacterium]
MKKLISVLSLLLALSFILSACKDTPSVTSSSSSSATSSSGTSSSSTSSTSSSTSSSEDPDELKGVFINEVVGKNYGGTLAPDGGEYDWIELYNHASTTADISGWMLTNEADDIAKFIFPQGTTIAPYGYLIVWAVGKDFTPTAKGHYAPFKVSASGETIILAAADFSVRDAVDVPEVDGSGKEWSYGRVADGGFIWDICNATPLAKNDNSVVQLPSNVFTISADSGFYD